jgi:hypothetical protein
MESLGGCQNKSKIVRKKSQEETKRFIYHEEMKK